MLTMLLLCMLLSCLNNAMLQSIYGVWVAQYLKLQHKPLIFGIYVALVVGISELIVFISYQYLFSSPLQSSSYNERSEHSLDSNVDVTSINRDRDRDRDTNVYRYLQSLIHGVMKPKRRLLLGLLCLAKLCLGLFACYVLFEKEIWLVVLKCELEVLSLARIWFACTFMFLVILCHALFFNVMVSCFVFIVQYWLVYCSHCCNQLATLRLPFILYNGYNMVQCISCVLGQCAAAYLWLRTTHSNNHDSDSDSL